MPEYPEGLPIGAGWVSTVDVQPVVFPFDGRVVGTAPVGTPELAKRAVDEAVGVAREVASLPSRVRRTLLNEVASAIEARRSEFENLLVLETGKPLVDCRVEVARTIVTWQAAAEEVSRIHGETVPLDLLPSGDGLAGFWKRKPIGVVVGIAGFNYPLLLASHKIAPAVAAGCPVIVKPAPQTPLATLWLTHLVRSPAPVQAMVQLVTGDASVGAALTTDRRIGAVSFTGSAAVGHRIARDAAPTKTLLELGSNAALVVAEDADLDAAADAIIRGGYYASGQACISVLRVVAVDTIRSALLEKLDERLPSVVVGDPRDPSTRVSALIDPKSTARVRAWVDQSVDAGAKVAFAAEGSELGPMVLTDVPSGQLAWDEEIFGPVIAVRSVPDL